ncbi:MAG: hypothetical protein LAN59_10045 [Acidobacteriia bacterium]|nr:hypothetical protein [Terriglobia bacterium]
MANPVSTVSSSQQAAHVEAAQAAQARQASQQKPANPAAPQDTVKISAAGRAASQAGSVDSDHDGDSK